MEDLFYEAECLEGSIDNKMSLLCEIVNGNMNLSNEEEELKISKLKESVESAIKAFNQVIDQIIESGELNNQPERLAIFDKKRRMYQ